MSLRKITMPRGSKPGERRGGRQRGTPNKKTALRNAALAAAASDPDISPLDFLLGIVRDANESSERRFKAAQTTLPFVHAKPGSARPGDPAGPAKLIDGTGAFTIDNAVAKALRGDYHTLGACPSNSGFCWSEKRESDSLPPHEQDIPRLEDR